MTARSIHSKHSLCRKSTLTGASTIVKSRCRASGSVDLPYLALTNLYVGSRSGNVYSFEVADLNNKNLDSSRSLYTKAPVSEPDYFLMYSLLTQIWLQRHRSDHLHELRLDARARRRHYCQRHADSLEFRNPSAQSHVRLQVDLHLPDHLSQAALLPGICWCSALLCVAPGLRCFELLYIAY